MKNIHLIPTDKPSRLQKTKHNNFFLANRTGYEYTDCTAQHIYITSDEEIKEGDWIIQSNFEKTNTQLIQCITKFQVKIANDKDGSFTKKKIILTTDQDLIKDGVQAIDDEFLEWFVKNPNCEEVEFEVETTSIQLPQQQLSENSYDLAFRWINKKVYKIIIPKEEPKQDYSGVHFRHCYQGEYEDGCKYGEDDCPAKPLEEPKQETVEEAAKEFVLSHDFSKLTNPNHLANRCFQFGAKWQQERMYSEEEAYKIWKAGQEYWKTSGTSITFEELLEQFKKQ